MFTTNASCPTAGIVIYYRNTNLSVIKTTVQNSIFKYNYNTYVARPGDADDTRYCSRINNYYL